MFSKIAIITIPVKDQEVAKTFYTDKLGCIVLEDMQMMPGSRWLRLEFSGVETRIVLANWFQQMTPGSMQGMVLATDDIAETCRVLKDRGVETTPIKNQPYGQESTFVDPDGNGWVLQQPKISS